MIFHNIHNNITIILNLIFFMMEKYSIYLPTREGSVESEWRQCLEQIKDVRLTGKKLAKLNIFIDSEDYTQYLVSNEYIYNSLLESFGDQCPTFDVTVHPPEKPWKVAVEAGYINSKSYEVVSKKWNSIPYIVRANGVVKEVLAYGLGTGLFCEDTFRAGNAGFDQMRAILEAEDMSFDNLVRQWNYIGGILEINNEMQNYQAFNEVRNENYTKYRSANGYPAATGIGMKFDGVKFDFIAVKAEVPINIIPIENPDQLNPYTYEQKVLKGIPLGGRCDKHPPQFERAVLLGNNLFISGTASIRGQDTIGLGDVEKQTVVTIENISKLYHSNKIPHNEQNASGQSMELIILRVYVKNQNDFAKVKAICSRYFPGVPAIYIEADICRDDLLVEIEAEYLKTS
jgi:enamine deaminase RidA (YjgF/YER057c/UK114 family)